MNNIEEKRNRLNLELRGLLSIIDMIDGMHYEYENYKPNELSEEEYLEQQLILVVEAKTRLKDIFK